MNLRVKPARFAEIVAFILLLAAIPVAVIGLLLPINEYSWMAPDSIPLDCDLVTGMFLFPAGVAFLGGLFGFGLLFLRRRTKLSLIGAILSAVILFGIGLKLPQYIRESARAERFCPK